MIVTPHVQITESEMWSARKYLWLLHILEDALPESTEDKRRPTDTVGNALRRRAVQHLTLTKSRDELVESVTQPLSVDAVEEIYTAFSLARERFLEMATDRVFSSVREDLFAKVRCIDEALVEVDGARVALASWSTVSVP